MDRASKQTLMGLGLTSIVLSVTFAQSPPPPPAPALAISILNTNQVQLQITNGVSGVAYEIYRRLNLVDPAYEWTFQTNGVSGQTNFAANIDTDTVGFFRATLADWDQDGVPNWQDGDPEDPNVLTLSITIDAPLNGTLFN